MQRSEKKKKKCCLTPAVTGCTFVLLLRVSWIPLSLQFYTQTHRSCLITSASPRSENQYSERNSRSSDAVEGDGTEKMPQFLPSLYLQVFCSIWPQFLVFLANSNFFCHLLSFPFSRKRKNNTWSGTLQSGPATCWHGAELQFSLW